MRCTACGAARPRAARFCPRCGDPQPAADEPNRVRRTIRGPIVVPIVAMAIVFVLAAALALGTALDDGSPGRDADVAGRSLEDATVELDREPAVPGRSPGAGTGAREQTPAPSCRRSDRAGSPCGPELPIGDDDPEALLMLTGDLAVIHLGDELVGIELTGGAERWRTGVFVNARSVRSASDDELLITAVAGGLAAIEHRTGTIRWTVAFADIASALPTRQLTTSITPVPVWVGDEGVLARDPAGRLHAFDRDDGASRWVVSMDAASVVATSRGLLSIGAEGLRLWHPDGPEPRWQRSGTDLRLHPTASSPGRLRPAEPVAAPLPLTAGRWLVDLDGGMVPLASTGSVEVALTGEVTLAVTWPRGASDDGGAADQAADDASAGDRGATPLATVTAFDAEGGQRWQTEVPLPCCEVRTVPSAAGELVLRARGDQRASPERIVVLDATDGTIGELRRRDGATLEALTATTTLWRDDGRLIGLDRRTGREAFRATGSLASIDPLVLQGPQRSLVIAPGGPIAPSDVARPGPRSGPDPAGLQGRGTAS